MEKQSENMIPFADKAKSYFGLHRDKQNSRKEHGGLDVLKKLIQELDIIFLEKDHNNQYNLIAPSGGLYTAYGTSDPLQALENSAYPSSIIGHYESTIDDFVHNTLQNIINTKVHQTQEDEPTQLSDEEGQEENSEDCTKFFEDQEDEMYNPQEEESENSSNIS